MFPRIRIRHAAETRWDQGKAASTFRKAAQVAEQRSLRQRITQAAATETFWPDGLWKSILFALFSFPFQQWSWATPKLQPRSSSSKNKRTAIQYSASSRTHACPGTCTVLPIDM